MKFIRLVALFGAFLVIQFAVLEWMGASTVQVDPNPNCTMACGPSNPTCVGTNTYNCQWCSNAGSGNCNATSTEWFNNHTNGSTTGSSQIEWAPKLQENVAVLIRCDGIRTLVRCGWLQLCYYSP